MLPLPTPIPGLLVLAPDRKSDDRGYFVRTWDREQFAKLGLDTDVALVATTYNGRAFTLRGMHFQREPFAETKLVRVTRGKIFDVAIDLRAGSPTYKQWHGVELSAENGHQFYIPKGFAHGYLTLEDHCELSYVLSAPYSAESASGVRWDDPAFGIVWPAAPRVIHPRDAGYPLLGG